MRNKKNPDARPGVARKDFAPFGSMGPVTFGGDTFYVVGYTGGFVIEVETTSGKHEVDWFSGDATRAVVTARTKYPGCRIEDIWTSSWESWLVLKQDIDDAREDAEYIGLDDEDE